MTLNAVMAPHALRKSGWRYLNFLRQKYSPKLLAIYYLWRYSQWITPSKCVKVSRPNSPVARSYSSRIDLSLLRNCTRGVAEAARSNTTRPRPLAPAWPASCWIFSNGLYFEVRVRCRRKRSSRSLSHLPMSFLFFFCYRCMANTYYQFGV